MHKVSFSKSRSSINIERIVCFTRRFSNGKWRRLCKTVIAADDERVECIVRIQIWSVRLFGKCIFFRYAAIAGADIFCLSMYPLSDGWSIEPGDACSQSVAASVMLTIPESFYREGDLENYAPKKYIIAFFWSLYFRVSRSFFLSISAAAHSFAGRYSMLAPTLRLSLWVVLRKVGRHRIGNCDT